MFYVVTSSPSSSSYFTCMLENYLRHVKIKIQAYNKYHISDEGKYLLLFTSGDDIIIILKEDIPNVQDFP